MWSNYLRIRLFIVNARTCCLFLNVGFTIIQVCETDRSGDHCQCKDSLLLTLPKRGSCHGMQRQREVPEWVPLKQKELGERMSRSFIVVSVGKVRQDKQA